MSSSNMVDLYIHVNVNGIADPEEAVDLFKASFKDSRLFELRVDTNGVIRFGLFDSDVPNSFDKDMEDLYQWWLEKFGVGVEGYWLDDADNVVYRCEFDHDGKEISADTDWLWTYSVEDIKAIQEYAREHYKTRM